jgi:hypothetical protein
MPAQRSMSLPISPPHHRRASASSISCSTGFSLQSGDTPAPARHSFIRGVYSAIPATSLPSVIERESTMESNIDNRSGVPCSASLPLPKSSPCKTMPLVFMTRGEREARSSKFYPGALTSPLQSLTWLGASGGYSDRVIWCRSHAPDITLSYSQNGDIAKTVIAKTVIDFPET